MKNKIEYILKKINIDYFIIFLVSLILAIPMLNSKLDVYTDDGIQHIARAFGTYETIKEGGIITKIISSFTNGFGYSWDLFYGSLSTYGIILCKFFTISWINAYKLFTYIALLLSGIFMYIFVYKFTESKKNGLLSGILYMSFPYHLSDLYIRNALGEFVSFVFIPLVFLGLYNLFNNKEKNYYLAIGAIGLIFTHNLSTIIVAIFAAVYVLINIKQLKDTYVIKNLIINTVFIVLITSAFWIPFLETKSYTEYVVYQEGSMSDIEQIENHKLSIKRLFATPNDERIVFELGPHIIMLVFSFMSYKILKENKKEYLFFSISGILCLFMTTKLFPWKILPDSFYIIQFPWRMLQMAGFFLCTICSINMECVIKKYKKIDTLIIIGISLLYIISLKGFIPYNEESIRPIEEYTLGEMSGKEYEVIAGTAKAEYLPKKAYDHRFYIATRDEYIYMIDGKAVIEDEKKENNKLKARITVLENNSKFELPYIYYPGYEVRIDGIICKDTYETENGFLGIKLPKDENMILEVEYTGTSLMKFSNILTIISLVAFLIFIWKRNNSVK